MITVHVLTRLCYLLHLVVNSTAPPMTVHGCTTMLVNLQSSIPEPPPPQTFKADEGPRGREVLARAALLSRRFLRVEAKQQPVNLSSFATL